MSDVTRILTAIEQGDAKASEELLPLVYNELRRMAAPKMLAEPAEWSQRLDTGKVIGWSNRAGRCHAWQIKDLHSHEDAAETAFI